MAVNVMYGCTYGDDYGNVYVITDSIFNYELNVQLYISSTGAQFTRDGALVVDGLVACTYGLRTLLHDPRPTTVPKLPKPNIDGLYTTEQMIDYAKAYHQAAENARRRACWSLDDSD